MPSEKEWVRSIIRSLRRALQAKGEDVSVTDGSKLLYAYEVLTYRDQKPDKHNMSRYETDILLADTLKADCWIPRVVIECKLSRISTHGAITYSTKASTHKNVHPYLRYGILLGDWGDRPLPGRLIRHGVHFDFMVSLKEHKPTKNERKELVEILLKEVEASRRLQEALTSKAHDKPHHTILHRRLELK